MEPNDGMRRKSRSRSFGMEARVEKDFVGVDIADPGDDRLVEEQAFNFCRSPVEPVGQLLRCDFERLRAEARDLWARIRGLGTEAQEKPELPDVAEKERVFLVLELEDEACMSVRRLRVGNDKDLPRHFQVENKRQAAVAFYKDHLAAPPDTNDTPASHGRQTGAVRTTEQGPIEKLGAADHTANDRRPKGADDRFNLRELGHEDILSDSRGGR
jgi:hypothetical protein